jgi:hypothetical protein
MGIAMSSDGLQRARNNHVHDEEVIKRQSDMSETLSMMSSSIDRLEDTTARLINKLQPVMRPNNAPGAVPTSVLKANALDEVSPLFRDIQFRLNKLNELTDELNQLNSSIEL